MARTATYTYFDSPCRASMALVEGAWTDDDKYKVGGYFASPLDKDTFVALSKTVDWAVVKASASTDIVIGKLVTDPEGEHVANSRHGTIQLFGDYIMEVELSTASQALGAITAGDSLVLTASGGKYGEGLWVKNKPLGTASFNGTICMISLATASMATGTLVPVLVGMSHQVGGY